MVLQSNETENLQWHPAFYAGLQIELKEDSDNLIFENEHQLGTKPKQIDVLIIKKEKDIPVKKNIGRIFRRYNIVEYKSPTDYLSINDFYKGCAYAMFYKSDTKNEDAIPIQDITLTFVSVKYPRKLLQHLKNEWGFLVEEKFQGIYYIRKEKDILPMQLIVTSRVSWDDNLWLHSLTNELTEKEQIQHIVDEYKRNKSNKLYESVMDIVVKANYEKFEEARKYMCKALEELMADVIKEREKEAIDRGMAKGIEQGIEQGMAKGIEQGMEAKGIEVFHNCLKEGMSVEQARSIAGISGELVQQELQGNSRKES